MTNHDLASIAYAREIRFPGSDREGRNLDELEMVVINSADLHAKVFAKTQNSRREIKTIAAFEDEHVPGTLRRVLVAKNPGCLRETWSPNDYDYVQGLWRSIAFVGPLLWRFSHQETHGFRNKRSHGTAIDEVIRVTTNQGVILQTDIADCFPTLAFQVLRGTILRGRLERYILQLHERFRQAVGNKGSIGQGLPAGHPISPSIAVLAIDELLRPVREKWKGNAVIVYADDITIIGPDVKWVGKILQEIEQALGLQGMKLKHAKTRYTDPDEGGRMEILGYEIDWGGGRQSPIIRPKDNAFKRLAIKIAEAPDPPTIDKIIKGWMNAYNRSNDPDLLRRRNEAIHEGYLLRATR
jgi:hypothetical protein